MAEPPEDYEIGQSMTFELPEVGVRALEYIYQVEEEKRLEQKKKQEEEDDRPEEERLPEHLREIEGLDDIPGASPEDEEFFYDETGEEPAEEGEKPVEQPVVVIKKVPSEPEERPRYRGNVASAQEMLDILNKQAAKTHEATPWRPQMAPPPKKEAPKTTQEIKKEAEPQKSVSPAAKETAKKEPDKKEAAVKKVSLIKKDADPAEKVKADGKSATTETEKKEEKDPRELAKSTAQLLAAQQAKAPPASQGATPVIGVDDEHASRMKAKQTAEMLAAQMAAQPKAEGVSILEGAPKAPPRPKPAEKKKMAEAEKRDKFKGIPQEYWDAIEFLEESIDQYERYLANIGRNGLAAANLGYYRDDIQDMLDMMKYDERVNLQPYWERIVKLDLQLRGKAPMYVREVGHNNFKQYQIINDPPQTSWWWYLNRSVAPPVIEPKFWEFWKKL